MRRGRPPGEPALVRFYNMTTVGPEGSQLGPCLLWTGAKNPHGYAQFYPSAGGNMGGHRFAYITAHGPIPKELQIDHLCRVRHCVRAAHMQLVSAKVNTLRGVGPTALNAKKTHCLYGHIYDEKNTYVHHGSRYCRRCLNRKKTERRRRKRAALAGAEVKGHGSG